MASLPPSIDPEDEAFIRAVDEEYRADELKKFARKYGHWILAAVGIILVAVAGYLFWQSHETKKTEALSEEFGIALASAQSGATDEAKEAFDKLSNAEHPAYRTLARLSRAGVAVNANADEDAITDLKAVIADDAAPAALKDVARMKLLRLEFDSLSAEEVLKQTEPYLDGDSPWFPIAGELAGLAHLKAGAPDKAGPIFYRIAADQRVPAGLRARAEQMAASLGQDVTKLMDEVQNPADGMGLLSGTEVAE